MFSLFFYHVRTLLFWVSLYVISVISASSSENNYSGKFSPTSDKHSFTTIGADNMDMINPFGSSSTDG